MELGAAGMLEDQRWAGEPSGTDEEQKLLRKNTGKVKLARGTAEP